MPVNTLAFEETVQSSGPKGKLLETFLKLHLQSLAIIERILEVGVTLLSINIAGL